MKLTITESKKNDLLGRTEITAGLTFDTATPNRAAVKQAVAEAAKSNADLTVVKKIDTRYGGQEAIVTAYAYTDQALFEKVEREYMRTRNAKEEPKAEEAPAEAAPAEATEEKSEEAPAKEKSEETPAEEAPAEEEKAEEPAEKKEGDE